MINDEIEKAFEIVKARIMQQLVCTSTYHNQINLVVYFRYWKCTCSKLYKKIRVIFYPINRFSNILLLHYLTHVEMRDPKS